MFKNIIRKYSEYSLNEYSFLFWENKNSLNLSPLFLEIIEKELQRLYPNCNSNKAIAHLKLSKTMQTSHHICPSSGQRFMAIDLQSLIALPPNTPYLIFATSAIPIRNSADTDGLVLSEKNITKLVNENSQTLRNFYKSNIERKNDNGTSCRVSLISSKFHKKIVGENDFEDKRKKVAIDIKNSTYKKLLNENNSYSDFCSKSYSLIQSKIFSKNIYMLDLNKIIQEYLNIQNLPTSMENFKHVHFSMGIKCLGSYRQCDYLPTLYQSQFKFDYETTLTTGEIPNLNKKPLDLYLNNEVIDVNQYKNIKMKEFWKSFTSIIH